MHTVLLYDIVKFVYAFPSFSLQAGLPLSLHLFMFAFLSFIALDLCLWLWYIE